MISDTEHLVHYTYILQQNSTFSIGINNKEHDSPYSMRLNNILTETRGIGW